VPLRQPIARTGFNRRDDTVSEVLVNIEAFFAHVVSPLLADSKGALARGLVRRAIVQMDNNTNERFGETYFAKALFGCADS
jgi:hypothetical protein